MRSRSVTLWKNIGIYAGILLLLGADAGFFFKYLKGKKDAAKALMSEIKGLEADFEKMDREDKAAARKEAEFKRKIRERQEELEGYGDFLPPESERPLVQKFVLRTLEDLYIEILKAERPRYQRQTTHSVLVLEMSLKGLYRDFKLFLARVKKSDRFLRIRDFDVKTLNTENNQMEAKLRLEAYFSNGE